MLNFSQFQVLTFDCYGTLIDWETGILDVLRPVLAERGVATADNQILETYARIEAAIEDGPYKPYRAILSEVMVNMGQHFVKVLPDKWTVVTTDGSYSAHFEHSVAVTENGPWILNRPQPPGGEGA